MHRQNKQADIVQKKKRNIPKIIYICRAKSFRSIEANFIKLENEGADKGFIEQAREQVEVRNVWRCL